VTHRAWKGRMWSIGLFFLCASSVLAQETKVVRVGVDAENEPWSFIPSRLLLYFAGTPQSRTPPPVTREELRTMVGLDVEVASALGRRMGVTVEFLPERWRDLEGGLVKKRFDLIVSSWTPSRRTPREIQASNPYYFWGLQIAVRSDNTRITSYKDLAGAKVAYTEDPAVEQTLQALHAASLGGYAEERDLFRDLEAGKVAVVIADSLYVRWRVANSTVFRAVGEPLNRLGYHVAVRAEDAELFRKVQEAVSALVASPEMAEIRRHWEGPDVPKMPKDE
jgi:polar amino acid transport system substrate-binding protein